jgi:hypothetical protein
MNTYGPTEAIVVATMHMVAGNGLAAKCDRAVWCVASCSARGGHGGRWVCSASS